LNLPVEVVGSPLVREADGLARSSQTGIRPPNGVAGGVPRAGAAVDGVVGERHPAKLWRSSATSWRPNPGRARVRRGPGRERSKPRSAQRGAGGVGGAPRHDLADRPSVRHRGDQPSPTEGSGSLSDGPTRSGRRPHRTTLVLAAESPDSRRPARRSTGHVDPRPHERRAVHPAPGTHRGRRGRWRIRTLTCTSRAAGAAAA
jgi:hypothetical protein